MDIETLKARIAAVPADQPESYGYKVVTPERRRAFELRQQVYPRELQAHKDEPMVIRMACCLSAYLMEKEIVFEDDVLAGFYLFAGNTFTSPANTAEEVLFARLDRAVVDETARTALDEFVKYVERGVCTRAPAGHVIAGYPHILAVGLGGLIAEAEAAIAEKGETPFRQSALITCRAAVGLIRRYGKKAAKLQETAPSDLNRKNFARIAEACHWVAEQPPRNFFEAVQLLCLVHEVIITEQRSGSLSLGRFDHYLAPYYERDKVAGRIDLEGAAIIVEAFFKKMASVPRTFQNLTLGGYDSSDGYCSNDLTRVALRTCRKLRKDQPLLTLRWHPTMPADLWDDILSLITTGVGLPAIFNDEICIHAKQNSGISPQDSEQYALVGCVEPSIAGREYAHTEGLRISWLKVLELILNGGRCLISGEEFTLAELRDLDTIPDFITFYTWFKSELRHFTHTAIHAANILDSNLPNHWPSPFLSATMDNCIQSGLDVTAGGTIYNNSAINAAGMANAVDCLLAIRKYVFEEKRFTLAELTAMLRRNFVGDEQTRLMIYNQCARFGSDAEAANMLADLTADFHAQITSYTNPRGGVWELGFYSVDNHAWLGEKTGASPDGRRMGYALANGMSPVQGTEKHGPTEVVQAIVKVDHTCFSNGMVLDLKFHPRFFTPPAHKLAFRYLVEAYYEMGGMEIQFNVIDRETLRAAQRNPEQYRDLVVRVSGFSAYFTSLGPTVQNEIIDRTEFEVI